MRLTAVLFFIIFIEGYIVLSSELLMIRQLVPFVGSSTSVVAIVIAAVLMPLSFGYYSGGRFKVKKVNGKYLTIRQKLINNVVYSSVYLLFGLTYIWLEIMWPIFEVVGIHGKITQTLIFSLIFIVYPVYLLGQTVPLISNYFSREKISEITGRMLFCSTTGSFMGSIFATLVLMSFIGVNNTVIVNFCLILLVVLILSRKIFTYQNFVLLFICSMGVILNSNYVMDGLDIVENNIYSTIVISEEKEDDGGFTRTMYINRSASSNYTTNPEEEFGHLKYMNKTFFDHIKDIDPAEKKSILVIGAGGFSLGLNDDVNDYVFVDIDGSLKDVTEEYLIKDKLGPNKKFVPEPARAFLFNHKEKYDFIFLDAFSNVMSVPPQLITKEFYQKVKGLLKEGGVVAMNVITYPDFATKYTAKFDQTFREVFPFANRHVINPYNGWQRNKNSELNNILYIYFDNRHMTTEGIYTDNKNAYFWDE
ncbi:MAG: fused MFS/spermidine synthase [Rickettsiales bacterium]|nr:fused MFS/spermidine synthase [Rickettsiales bacterium]